MADGAVLDGAALNVSEASALRCRRDDVSDGGDVSDGDEVSDGDDVSDGDQVLENFCFKDGHANRLVHRYTWYKYDKKTGGSSCLACSMFPATIAAGPQLGRVEFSSARFRVSAVQPTVVSGARWRHAGENIYCRKW